MCGFFLIFYDLFFYIHAQIKETEREISIISKNQRKSMYSNQIYAYVTILLIILTKVRQWQCMNNNLILNDIQGRWHFFFQCFFMKCLSS